MPKNNKPQGGRPARNFDPRYGAKKTSFHDRHAGGRDGSRDDARGGARGGDSRGASSERPARESFDRRPGSRSAGHRGYRPAEAESGAPKRRWNDSDRAGRDDARSFGNRADAGRRDDRGGAERPRFNSERPRFDRDDRSRGASNDRPRFNSERPARGGDRGGFSNERPRFNRDDRGGFNSERPRFNRDERPARDGARGGSDRPRFNSERPARDGERPRFNRDDRGGFNNERPRFNRDERPARDGARGGSDRPRFNSERPARDGAERPRFNSERPRFDRDDRSRGASNDRPRFNRDERPARDGDRPRYNSDRPNRDDRGGDRPRFNRDERPARDGDRPRYNSDRPNRDDRPRRDDRGGAERPRYNSDRPNRDDRGGDRARNSERPTRNDWNAKPKGAPQHTDDVVHERLEAKTVAATEVEGITFADLGIGSNIVEVLSNMGAASPFPIQSASIPAVLEGRDVLARGRTGSGKTIAFGAPLVERVLRSQAGKRREYGRSPRAIILAPTRELALQIDRTIQPIARSVGLFTTQVYGGVPQGRQVGALMKGVDIVIGTPGRIEDLIKQRKLDLSEVQVAVLDEADHMCELGFVEPVQRILRHTAEGSQKLLFSATLDREVAALVDEFLVDPAVFEVAGEDQDSSTIEHRVLVIEHREKSDILTNLVDREGKTLVFARTRAFAEMLAEEFDNAGIPAVSLHGDLNQAKRTRNLERLSSGRVQVLVATDVAARGIHVDDIDLVIQADAPDEYKTYLHRAGRTGRAGRAGRVVTLITRQRQRRMAEMLDRAEIDAPFDNARIGDDVLEEIAGRLPSNQAITA